MSSKTLILFPTDPSTKFLERIFDYLSKKVSPENFTIIKIDCTEEAHRSAIDEIEKIEYGSIIFLGHGNSSALQGSKCEKFTKPQFLTHREFAVFKRKNIMLVSCESSSLLKRAKGNFISGLGFGDLPTDWNDIQGARETDASAYDGFTEDTIESFRNYLTEMIQFTLGNYFQQEMTLSKVKDLLLLLINKKIATNYHQKVQNHEVLNDCLLIVKSGVHYFEE